MLSGTGFQVLLKIDGQGLVRKGAVDDEFPGFELGCAAGWPGVVGFHAGFQIAGEADLSLSWQGILWIRVTYFMSPNCID
jgi:hypothetical protein